MYHAKNCYVKIDNTEMEYVTFGNGTQPFIIIPGLAHDQAKDYNDLVLKFLV